MRFLKSEAGAIILWLAAANHAPWNVAPESLKPVVLARRRRE